MKIDHDQEDNEKFNKEQIDFNTLSRAVTKYTLPGFWLKRPQLKASTKKKSKNHISLTRTLSNFFKEDYTHYYPTKYTLDQHIWNSWHVSHWHGQEILPFWIAILGIKISNDTPFHAYYINRNKFFRMMLV